MVRELLGAARAQGEEDGGQEQRPVHGASSAFPALGLTRVPPAEAGREYVHVLSTPPGRTTPRYL